MATDRTTVKERKFKLQLQKRKVLVLTVLSGENIGKEYLLSKKKVLVGRDASADVAISDRLMSRRHAELVIKKRSKRSRMPCVILTDLSSTNGTFLNYEPITKAILKDGDKIILGRTVFKLEHKDVCDQQFLDRLLKLATLDELTGLYNKASIIKMGKEEFSRARRYRRPLSFLMLDIDLFKTVNDTYGHVMGDVILKRIGYVISSSVREQDRTGRFGGEEFLILLPETELPEAVCVAERISEKVRALKFTHKSEVFHITVSIGICSYLESLPESFEAMLDMADQALYVAKKNGRNRAVTTVQAHEETAARRSANGPRTGIEKSL